MNNIIFSPKGWADYCHWQKKEHIKILSRITRILEDIQRYGPMEGIGKPEPLRHRKGWSRRIDDENRLVYTIENGDLIVIACRGHYESKIAVPGVGSARRRHKENSRNHGTVSRGTVSHGIRDKGRFRLEYSSHYSARPGKCQFFLDGDFMGKGASGAGSIRKKTVTRNGKTYTYWEGRVTTGRHPGTGKQIHTISEKISRQNQ